VAIVEAVDDRPAEAGLVEGLCLQASALEPRRLWDGSAPGALLGVVIVAAAETGHQAIPNSAETEVSGR